MRIFWHKRLGDTGFHLYASPRDIKNVVSTLTTPIPNTGPIASVYFFLLNMILVLFVGMGALVAVIWFIEYFEIYKWWQ